MSRAAMGRRGQGVSGRVERPVGRDSTSRFPNELSPASVSRSTGRRGFSLVELLVVVAVLVLLAALLLPAAQYGRESARRTTCQNHLRQLAQAIGHYESGLRRLPAAASVTEAFNPGSCNGCFNPWAEARLPANSFSPGTRQGTSWILPLLPHLERGDLSDRWNKATNVLGNASVAASAIPGLLCPTRRGGIRVDRGDHQSLIDTTWRGGGTDYGGCYGRLDGFLNTTADDHRFADVDTPIADSVGSREGIFQTVAGRMLRDVSDGLSSTIMLGEVQRLRPIPGGTTAATTGNRTSQDGWAVGGAATLFVTATDPARGNPGGINNWFFESSGSEHLGGGFFAMADGSVQWLSECIDAKNNNAVFPLLGSIRDGVAVGLRDATR